MYDLKIDIFEALPVYYYELLWSGPALLDISWNTIA